MLQETKVYSDFIKRNNIIVGRDLFIFRLSKDNYKNVPLSKDDDGKWYAENDDKCYTKKAAIYYYIKNRFECENGIILNYKVK